MLRSDRSCGVNVVKVEPSALLGRPPGGAVGIREKLIAPSRVLTVLSAAQLEPPTLATDAAAALSASLTFFFFFFFFLTSPFAARATTEATPESFFPIAPTFLESRRGRSTRTIVAWFSAAQNLSSKATFSSLYARSRWTYRSPDPFGSLDRARSRVFARRFKPTRSLLAAKG